jgi:UDP-3-O-[3-hydroxymyristoyl] glucosamine N-acyltransferase
MSDISTSLCSCTNRKPPIIAVIAGSRRGLLGLQGHPVGRHHRRPQHRPGALEAARGNGGTAPAGPERNELQKIHSLSIVEIGDDVEVGVLTAIDRGTLKPTRIGAGTKIDDLVMIGHNVEIGMDCLLCGQVGLAGGVIIGDGAVLGGRVGVADHLKIGAWAVVAAAACVGTNIPAGAVYAGYSAVPRAEAMEN